MQASRKYALRSAEDWLLCFSLVCLASFIASLILSWKLEILSSLYTILSNDCFFSAVHWLSLLAEQACSTDHDMMRQCEQVVSGQTTFKGR